MADTPADRQESESESPLFAHLTANGKALAALSEGQHDAVSQFLQRDYQETPNPCLCRAGTDLLVACRDRFGIPVRVVLCRNCGLMRNDPYLDDTSVARFYRDDYRAIHTSKWSDDHEYFDLQQWRGRRILSWLADHDVAPPNRVFEIGCGAGGILAAFRNAGSDAVGCDYGIDLLEFGRRAGLTLEAGSAASLKPHGQADMIIMSHVVEHLRDPIAELRQVQQLLSPDGLLYVEVPGLLVVRRREKTLENFLQYAHVWHFSQDTLRFVLGLTGFHCLHQDEGVHSLFSRDESNTPNADVNAFKKTLRYLRFLNRVRRLPRLTTLAVSAIPVVRGVLGKRLYNKARAFYGRLGGEIA